MSVMLNSFVLFPAASGPVVLDTFTEGETTVAITSHTPETKPVGSSWGGYTTNFTVNGFSPNDFLYLNDTNKNNGPIIDSGLSDCRITATLKTSNGGIATSRGITFRNTETTSAVPSWSGVCTYSFLRIIEAGVTRAELTGKAYDSAGAEHDIVVTANGATVTCSVFGDTVTYNSATSNQTITTHGPKCTNGSLADRVCYAFKVEPL